MTGYRVLIVIKGQWWSDQKTFAKLNEAQKHRHTVAERWSDCDTAIASPRNEVMYYRDSLLEQRALTEAAARLRLDTSGQMHPAACITARGTAAISFSASNVRNRGEASLWRTTRLVRQDCRRGQHFSPRRPLLVAERDSE